MMRYESGYIGEIPTTTVDNHNEVVHFWQKAGIKDAAALHVDAHADMSEGCQPMEEVGGLDDPLHYYKALGIGNFLCAAVHHDIISSLYWLNPHSEERNLQDMGSKKNVAGIPKLDTKIEERRLRWNRDLEPSKGRIIQPAEMQLGKPFILDIDLDGFCCNKNINYRPSKWRYDGVHDFESRVDQLIQLLRGKNTPDIITIVKSVSGNGESTFMPPDKVKGVQEYLRHQLEILYAS